MNLDRVTITGADDTVTPAQLVGYAGFTFRDGAWLIRVDSKATKGDWGRSS